MAEAEKKKKPFAIKSCLHEISFIGGYNFLQRDLKHDDLYL